MIRKLAPYTKGYRVYILLGILCSAGEAVLELMLPKAMSNIVDYGIGGNGGAGDRTYILTMGLKMVLMALICLALGVGAAALAAKAGMGFGANVRDAEYRQVQRFSFSNIEHFSTASLITRLTNDVSSVQMTLMMGMRMLVRAPVMLITALVMALRISLQLSQIFLVILPLLALMVFIMLRYVGPFFTSLQKGHRRAESGGAGGPERHPCGEILRPGGPGEGEVLPAQRDPPPDGGSGPSALW